MLSPILYEALHEVHKMNMQCDCYLHIFISIFASILLEISEWFSDNLFIWVLHRKLPVKFRFISVQYVLLYMKLNSNFIGFPHISSSLLYGKLTHGKHLCDITNFYLKRFSFVYF